MTPDSPSKKSTPTDDRPQDVRAIIAGLLAVISLLGTIAVVIIGVFLDKDVAVAAATLGGFTTTFGAYALGIQSEVRK